MAATSLYVTLGLFVTCLVTMATSTDDCLKGESFWCQNIDNALSCSAVSHCFNGAWKNEGTLMKETTSENTCETCVDVLSNLKVDNKKESIKLKAMTVCNSFESGNSMCNEIVGQTVEDAIEELVSENDVMGTCQELGQCDEEGSVIPMSLIQEIDVNQTSNSIACKYCKKVMDAVKKAIGSNPTKEKIEKELAKACSVVPKIARKACQKLLKKFEKILINLILNKKSSLEICQAVHVCYAQGCPGNDEVQVVSNQCQTCEVVVRLTDRMTDGNRSEYALRSALPEACKILPCKYQSSCFTFNEKFETDLFHLFTDHVSVEEICTKLQVCNDENDEVSNYKCVAGPNYWCSSPKNAKLCDADDHCKKNVWA